jgi:hypothetical protein
MTEVKTNAIVIHFRGLSAPPIIGHSRSGKSSASQVESKEKLTQRGRIASRSLILKKDRELREEGGHSERVPCWEDNARETGRWRFYGSTVNPSLEAACRKF